MLKRATTKAVLFLSYWATYVEAAFHAIDAHLADMRGDVAFKLDSLTRRTKAESRMARINMNRRFA